MLIKKRDHRKKVKKVKKWKKKCLNLITKFWSTVTGSSDNKAATHYSEFSGTTLKISLMWILQLLKLTSLTQFRKFIILNYYITLSPFFYPYHFSYHIQVSFCCFIQFYIVSYCFLSVSPLHNIFICSRIKQRKLQSFET